MEIMSLIIDLLNSLFVLTFSVVDLALPRLEPLLLNWVCFNL